MKRFEWVGGSIAAVIGVGLLVGPGFVSSAVQASAQTTAVTASTDEGDQSWRYNVSSITSNDTKPITATDTQSFNSGAYSLMTATLHSGKDVKIRWNPCQAVVSYRVNLDDLPKAQRAEMLRTVMESFKKLHTATGIIYRYRGDTSFVPQKDTVQEQPAEIVVAVVRPESKTDFEMEDNYPGWGGVLWTSWFDQKTEGAAAVRGQVLLDANQIADLPEGFGAGATRGNIVLHELGHVMGLADSTDQQQLMYPKLSASTPDGFADEDTTALGKVGTESSCIDIPDYVKVGNLN
ncbi:matrixin family metalloprotease [Kineosporia sp. NBRC 101731]|uniref:matrixin family metalloprotease n=1 Tax=Kineosporia sp. NBRC 101731 TaxID=3032199 RepID=UPI002556234B|nr:matrixin family metalloprotease [Kineosporia sp. NBRC 101731]